MNRLLLRLCCVAPLFAFAGCGGGEEKPPEKAPEMTSEEKAHMESEMAKMKDMYSKNKGKTK
jgi:hypothetical protein